MQKINVITIDGPSASGKGALSKAIAKSFQFKLLDSGALYRLYAYLFNMSFTSNEIADQITENVNFILDNKDLSIKYLDNDVTDDLRSEIIAKTASEFSSRKEVRTALFSIQSGQEFNMRELMDDIKKRDLKDSSRELAPLFPAEDAHIIDSSNLSLEEVFSITENLIKKEFN